MVADLNSHTIKPIFLSFGSFTFNASDCYQPRGENIAADSYTNVYYPQDL